MKAHSTYGATYVDSGDHTLGITVSGPTSTSTGVVSITNAIYNDATQSSGGSLLSGGATDYNAAGQVADTKDQYGGETISTYDINGRTIRTVSPNGTETRTVYDAMGRVIWQTDAFVPVNSDLTSTANVANATYTQYDSLGRAYRTERYSGVAITLVADIDGFTKSVASATGATQLSSTQSWYDQQGRTIETKDAAGLRTGTIYLANGQVQATGPLAANAPDGGHVTTSAGVTSYSFTTDDFLMNTVSNRRQYTSYLYDQAPLADGSLWASYRYSSTTDANGHTTRTFVDNEGRTVFTVFDDGSFTQTVYSVGDQAIPGYDLTPTIPAGGSETISIAQLLRSKW